MTLRSHCPWVCSPPQSPLQHRGTLGWGPGREAGTEESPVPWGRWLAGQQGGHGARASPRLPHHLDRTQRSGPQLLLESGGAPSPSSPHRMPRGRGRRPPNHARTRSRQRHQPEPLRSPAPQTKAQRGRWEARLKSKSQIHSLKEKSENPKKKKKKIMIKRCANDEVPPVRGGGRSLRNHQSVQSTKTSLNQNTKTNKKWGEKNKKQRSENICRPQDGVGGRRGRKSYHREGSRWPANLLLAALYREQFDA